MSMAAKPRIKTQQKDSALPPSWQMHCGPHDSWPSTGSYCNISSVVHPSMPWSLSPNCSCDLATPAHLTDISHMASPGNPSRIPTLPHGMSLKHFRAFHNHNNSSSVCGLFTSCGGLTLVNCQHLVWSLTCHRSSGNSWKTNEESNPLEFAETHSQTPQNLASPVVAGDPTFRSPDRTASWVF